MVIQCPHNSKKGNSILNVFFFRMIKLSFISLYPFFFRPHISGVLKLFVPGSTLTNFQNFRGPRTLLFLIVSTDWWSLAVHWSGFWTAVRTLSTPAIYPNTTKFRKIQGFRSYGAITLKTSFKNFAISFLARF